MATHAAALGHAKEIAGKAFSEAIQNIDKAVGTPGYAANHPELIRAYIELFLAVYQTDRAAEK
ncbi:MULTISPECIES: hypothetical protein [Neisseria]|uniref:hypothetical protein n=1 Tax=Neisseria TaxID=482 RepID=UPI0008A38A93|nr:MULTISPECIES: hypothetical protein [Neisseria]OFN77818.1 hypothetical protein HMPREF2572_08930 [Neisseria sp. HMSC064E01]